ncbi:hypothetical protein KDH_27650 [Dictyobacter sp. S3.2.2.5]|uniref:LamG-like jellyroll fold domain-containing protein n=1 Tax=Dictyobacter halimunensis TaxID=3026934 RepID=A0ABQ6FNS9_9CHLR|nr:hypothetical protein KDH_27650 [Dictyobacter sp. S3.2.2.5]
MQPITITDNRLTTFYKQNADFDILHINLSDQTALSRLNWHGLDQASIVDLLKKYQRLLRLNPDPNVAMALLGVAPVQSAVSAQAAPLPATEQVQATLSLAAQPAPPAPVSALPAQAAPAAPTPATSTAQAPALDSAHAIAAIPAQQFVQQFAPAVGGVEAAQQLHQDATTVATKTALLWANVQNVVASPYFRSFQVNNISSDIYQFEQFPDYQELFGSLNFCTCDECASIFGPAAYFVDLMRIVDQYITTPNAASIPPSLKLSTRRPDLAQIALTCENTNNLVLFLDVVNDILALKIANTLSLSTSAQTDPVQASNATYQALASASYPFNLPFNLPLEQIRAYLGQLNTDLATVYRTFNLSQEAVAREALRLSLEEYALITTPKPTAADLSTAYGITVSANDPSILANQETFLAQTGLSRQDLQDLLNQNLSKAELDHSTIAHAFYINEELSAGKTLQFATDGSDTIANLDLPTLDRLQRFIRLSRKLNWSFADLDWTIQSFQASEITPDLIQKIAKIQQLQARLKLPLNILSSFWSDLKTTGVGMSGASQAPFDIVFTNPQLLGRQAPYHPQYVDTQGNALNPLYTDAVLTTANGGSSRIASGLRVGLDDLTLLIATFGKGGQLDFTVQNLSLLYRHSRLAALLQLPLDAYLLLLNLTGKLQPVFAPDDLLSLLDTVDWLRSIGISVYELAYILRGTPSKYVAGKYQASSIPTFLQVLLALGIDPQPVLTLEDILDWASLTQKLNNPAQAGPGQRVWSLLPTSIQQVITQVAADATKLTDQVKSDLLTAFNGILQRPDFYQAATFSGLSIPDPVKALLQADTVLSQNEIQKLNRLLLQAAYPQEIVQITFKQLEDEWKEKLLQQLATFVSSPVDRVTALLEIINRLLSSSLPTGMHSYIEVFLAPVPSADTLKYVGQVLDALSRGLVLAEKLQLKSSEIASLRTAPASYGIATDFLSMSVDNLKSLAAFKQLAAAFQDTQDQLLAYLASASASTTTLATITGWLEAQIQEVVSGHFQNLPQVLTTVDGLVLLKKVFDLSTSLGVNIAFHDQILPLATLPVQNNWASYTSAASGIVDTIKARYNDDDWAVVNSQVLGAISERKRSALAGFLIWKLGLKNLRALTEYLLIDVEMSGCASISLIKQGILSLQMYLQRCRLNLEPGVTSIGIPSVWWEWMMNYSIWQANRKVFLYPENYLDPGLRKNKSDLFQQLESELLQADITQELVETAYIHYFDKFAELAKLNIVASYRCQLEQTNDQDAIDTLFLFARTASEPATYYYRECRYPTAPVPTWTPWSKIDVNINAEYIAPAFAFNRLFVFWVESSQAQQSTVTNNQAQRTTVQKATIKYILQTESKQWRQPQTLAKDIIIDVTSTDASIPDFHIDTERLFWKKVYPLTLSETGTQPEQLLVMFGDIPDLPTASPPIPAAPSQDPGITQFDRQTYEGLQQGYLATQNGIQGYGSLLPAITLSSDAATENRYLLLPQARVQAVTSSSGLSQGRSDLAATTVGNLAIFVGGYNSGVGFSAAVDIYNSTTGQWSSAQLSKPRTWLAATALGNLAFFVGGQGADYQPSNTIDIYNINTRQWSSATLSQPRLQLAATATNNQAFFAGGLNNNASGNLSDVVDIFSTSTAQWSTAKLSQPRSGLAATSANNLALFAGGMAASNTFSDVVDIYNASNGQWSTARLSQPRYQAAATAANNQAFFAGGSSASGPSDVVDIYNASTGQWSMTRLSQPRYQLAATAIGSVVLFAGGLSASGLSDVVDIYNVVSGQWSIARLSLARSGLAATSAGGQAFFAGGISGIYRNTVDIFSSVASSAVVGIVDGTTLTARTVSPPLHASYMADTDRALLNHLIGYWPLDEGAGTVLYDRASSHDGSTTGPASWQTVTDFPGTQTRSALQFGTQGDYLSLPPTSIPVGLEITLSFWAYGGPSLPQAVSVFFATASNSAGTSTRVVNVHLPWSDEMVYFDCGVDTSGTFDRIAKKANSLDYKGKWSHWTFTKNVSLGEMKIYLNGLLWYAESNKTRPLVPVTQIMVGNGYDGKLAELHIWDTVLSAEQILVLAASDSPLLKDVSGQNAVALTVKNQADWMTFDNGDEAFLIVPQANVLKPLSDGLGVQEINIPGIKRGALALGYPGARDASTLSGLKFSFTRLTTTVMRQLSQRVLVGGVDQLLTPEAQAIFELDFTRFQPSSAVIAPTTNALDFRGPYGLYFQEIFFHIPLLVANALNTNQRFAEAQKWYHYIFNPTQTFKAVNAQNLLGYWSFNEGSGTALVDTVGSHNGTIQGTASWQTVSDFPGTPSRAVLQLGVQGSCASLPPASVPSGSEITVSFWAYGGASLPKMGSVIYAVGSDGTSRALNIHLPWSDENIYFDCGCDMSGGYDRIAYKASPQDYKGTWTHWTFTKNTALGEMKIYLNGQLWHAETGKTRPLIPVSKVVVGQDIPDNALYDGKIAELRIWNYALSPEEALLNAGDQSADRFWRYLPFRDNSQQKLEALLQDSQALMAYNDDPFDPDAIAQLRLGAYQKAVVMKYIDNLLDWGDSLFTQDSWESITQATLLYLLAYDLLGPRPESVGQCSPPAPKTFADIKAQYSSGNIPQFLLELEPMVSSNTATVTSPAFNMIDAYFCVGENNQFTAYWDRVDDRLYKIRHCQNIAGTFRQLALFEPPLNPADLVRAAASNIPLSAVAGLSAQVPHYRFDALLERAKNITSTLIQLGSTLLSVLEKKDVEQLSLLRATQETVIQQLLNTTRQKQLDEANATLASLNQSLTAAQHRMGYYQDLVTRGLTSGEQDSQNLLISAVTFETLATVLNTIASPAYAIPTIFGLADGGVSPGGVIAALADASGRIANTLNLGSSLAVTMAQYARRMQEWQFQLQMAQDDIDLINKQIVAAQLSADIASSELATQQKSSEQANEIQEFLQRKFSNQDLYQWMLNRLSVLYFQMFKLALEVALTVQTAYQYELNRDDTFISFDYWDSLKQGLLAGEGLLFGLSQLEKAYLEHNSRRLEVEKTVSLLRLDPKAFLDLKNSGKCQFQLSEKLFDYDFPGHYCRQIKTIDISIPAIIGPYQNINATLTQLSNRVVVQADQNAVAYLLTGQGNQPDTSILRSNWRRNQKIALSRGVNDSGLFELNFRDERYLPFEGTGAVSTWELRLPKATNRIDFDNLSDIIIHLSYTALDAGDSLFTQKVQELLTTFEGAYYLNLNQSYPGAWHSFVSTQNGQNSQQLKVGISNQIIPPHLTSVKLENVYFKLTVPDSTIPSAAAFLSLQIGNGSATPVSLNSSIATVSFNPPLDQFVGDWIINVDLTKVPQALLKNGVLDPALFQNIECILCYQGEIDWTM